MYKKIILISKIIKFYFLNLIKFLLRFLNKVFKHFFSLDPLVSKPYSNEETYRDLFYQTSKNIYKEVDKYENLINFKISKSWIDDLALTTQITIKNNELCYAHGRVLYSALRYRINNLNSKENLTILETGTARGFSALCMAKALDDNISYGKIYTIDQLPHSSEIYWNSISDHLSGKITRKELLKNWSKLIHKYIIFLHGDSRTTLDGIHFSRVHFAFLDGCHTYKDVFFEFNSIKNFQFYGDMIIFDDYTHDLYDGVVRAVDEICKNNNYDKKLIYINDKRSVLIATKSK